MIARLSSTNSSSCFLGSIVSATNVLNFGDLVLGMAFPNILGMVLLSVKVKAVLASYMQKLNTNEFKTFE